MILDREFIERYTVEAMPYHEFYTASVTINNELEVHANKDKKPDELLNKARPNEHPIYQKWRSARWTPITHPYWKKILFNSSKVGKADDWGMDFPDSIASIPESESLKKYLTVNYPYWDSLENWFWKVGFETMFRDPDGVVCVVPLPKKNPEDDTEYLRPFTYIYRSSQVVDFKEGEYAVLEMDEKSIVSDGRQNIACGRMIMIITDTQITIAKQVGELRDWKFEIGYNGVEVFSHNIGHLPVFQLGGLIKEFKPGYKLFDSFAGPCVPHFNEAVMDYSDHQVNKALHLHPDKWSYVTSDCAPCKGSGQIQVGENKERTTCKTCNGLGKISVETPFGVTLLKTAEQVGINGAVQTPTPPKGYVDRPVETIKLLKEEYQDDIREGMASLNMEFAMNVPGDQSGIAKAYDRDPLVSYYELLGSHIVCEILRPSCYFISKWRYSELVKSEEDIDNLQPVMMEPKRFDIIISSMLSESLKSAHEAGMNSSVTAPLEVQFAIKQFGENSIQAKIAKVMSQFDPLAGKTDDEKMVILSNKGCTQEDYILSSKLYAFILRAIEDNKAFLELDYKGKKAVFDTYVAETVAGNKKSLVPILSDAGTAQPVA